MSILSRRSFLATTAGAATGLTLVGSTEPAAADDVTLLGTQGNWRFCSWCYVLFFDGYPAKGYCPADPAGSGHRAQGWNFYLHYDFPGAENWQIGWRFCPDCYTLIWPFDPTPWGHNVQGWVFALHHGVGETAQRQSNWRYCWRCDSLFFWGYPDNGWCHAGGQHQASGFHFVLYHT